MVCILQSFPEQQLRSLTGEHWSFLPNRLTYELPLASFVGTLKGKTRGQDSCVGGTSGVGNP